MNQTLFCQPTPPCAPHQHGGDFHNYIEKNPDRLPLLLHTLGVPKKKIPRKVRRLGKQFDTCAQKESLNQLLAVIDRKKPLWFGNAQHLRTFLREFPPQKQKNPPELQAKTLEPYGLFGKPKLLQTAAKELERIQRNPAQADRTFHQTLGLLLGYPKKDVETFVQNFPSTTPPN